MNASIELAAQLAAMSETELLAFYSEQAAAEKAAKALKDAAKTAFMERNANECVDSFKRVYASGATLSWSLSLRESISVKRLRENLPADVFAQYVADMVTVSEIARLTYKPGK